MNWVKENKFLAGVLLVLVLGIGVLGWLLFGAMGRLGEATTAYEQQSAERTRLHRLVPYPSPDNVKDLQAQKADATAKITDLQRSLAATELPIEPLTPAGFQDKLREAVTAVKTAAGTQTKLGSKDGKFFLAFDKYETSTPEAAAAGPLGRELKAIQWLVTRFIEAKAAEIRDLQRDPLPEEGGKPKAPAVPEKTPARGGKPAEPAVPLVQPHGIDIVVFGDQSGLRNVLNEIVTSKQQFFIPRLISFKNEKPTPPPRVDPSATLLPDPNAADPNAAPAPADPNAPPAAPGAPGAKPPSTYIVGEERVELTLRLEMIDFAEPAALAAKAPGK